MPSEVNFFRRVLTALVEGRAREAERYVARVEAEQGFAGNRVKSR